MDRVDETLGESSEELVAVVTYATRGACVVILVATGLCVVWMSVRAWKEIKKFLPSWPSPFAQADRGEAADQLSELEALREELEES